MIHGMSHASKIHYLIISSIFLAFFVKNKIKLIAYSRIGCLPYIPKMFPLY